PRSRPPGRNAQLPRIWRESSMKRNTLLGSGIVLAGLLVSCGGGSGTQDTTADTTAAPAAGPTEASVDLSNAGTVTGTIAFSGEDTDRPLDLGGDPTCLD